MSTSNSKNKKQDERKYNNNKNICKIVPNLLLNYTYALNLSHTKFICTGFDSSTFEEKLILNDALNDFIELTCLDWYSIFVKLKKINEIVHKVVIAEPSCKSHSKIFVSKKINFQITKDVDTCVKIVIQKHHETHKQKIDFNYLEYTNFYALSEFIHLVITYNRSASSSISAYFQAYVKKCEELDTCALTSHHFFTPANHMDQNIINYSRLFYEFSFLCFMKLYTAREDALREKNHI